MNKIEFIVNLRIVCTVAVVVLHVAAVSFNTYNCDLSYFGIILAGFLYVFTRFSVPVFIMITGALLLDPVKQIDLRKVYCNYIWRIVTVLCIVGFVYAALEVVFSQHSINTSLVPICIRKVLSGDLWDHMWYLYMLIGLYMVLPLLKRFVNTCTEGEMNVLLLLLFFFNFVLPVLHQYVGLKLGIQFPVVGSSIFYFLVGYRLMTLNRELNVYCIGIIILFAAMLFMLISVDIHAPKMYLSYSSPIICIVSIAVFMLFKNLPKNLIHALYRYCASFSKYSFGIYIFHPFFLNIINKVLHFNPMAWGEVSFVLVVIVCIVLSVMTTAIYQRIPKIGRYI